MKSRFLLSLYVITAFASLRAQHKQYQFSGLDNTNGLSHNQVTSIFKDHSGFMWFGTLAGLNRYDGYKFKTFRHDLHDTTSVDDDYIMSITEGPAHSIWIRTRIGFNIYDPKTEQFNHNVAGYLGVLGIPAAEITAIVNAPNGDSWFALAGNGIYRYSLRLKKTVHYAAAINPSALHSNDPSAVAADASGNLWLMHPDGVLEKLDAASGKISFRTFELKTRNRSNLIYSLFIDQQDDIWIFAPGSTLGASYFNQATRSFRHISAESAGSRLNANIINGIIQDTRGMIWIGTDHGGINLLDKRNFSVQYLVNREGDDKSIRQNSITAIYRDASGIVWLGTYKRGISYYHEDIIKFPLYRHLPTDPNSLNFDDVNRFAEDDANNLWIGTNGGGLIYFNRRSGKFTQYRHDPRNSNSLSNDVIVSLWIDHQKKLWIGTYFGGLDCFDGKTFTHYVHRDADSRSISDDRVWEIMEDSGKSLWVGTLAGGLNLFDRSSGTFRKFRGGGANVLSSDYISALMEDHSGRIWIGTDIGVDIFSKKTNSFAHYRHSERDEHSLVHNYIYAILEDSRKMVWIATREGLSVLDPATRKFINFRKENGLPDNTILDLREDMNHNLWLSTPEGLSHVKVGRKGTHNTFSFTNYDETDGLQGRGFNENASYRTRMNELVFGGANGFNMFNPLAIRNLNKPVSLVLTDFFVFDKSMSPGTKLNGHLVLPQSITETNTVTLNHDENVFSIEFAALNFFNPDKVKHQYRLDGFNKQWLNSDNKTRRATYTNLDPGTYVFRVRASGNEGSWSDSELKLRVIILPPLWKTPAAYAAYVLLAVGGLLLIRQRGIRKLKTRFALEQERQQAQRMHELDMMKIKFFTNVSHEFRTPLSLIMAPVDKALKNTDEPVLRKQLVMVSRNARRLLNLVNQLLDFRKMEVNELRLHTSPGDIITFIKEISYSFTDLAEKKNIRFLFDSEMEELYTCFDHDKVERILFNLLSNAFKFTPQQGTISVLLTQGKAAPGREVIEIRVVDSGIGIPAHKLGKIFDRFFQDDVPGSIVNQGSGIGLSITREFVKLHHGEITVESEPDEGSCFTIILPFQVIDIPAKGAPEDEQFDVSPETGISAQKKSVKLKTVLLVEDNDDFRFYLKDNLKENYHIIQASNGREGWQKALSMHPDLVVSDISMPEMNGIELCKKIKSDSRTAHLPVILLTALTGEQEQLQGLGTGAADYMTKPFNFEILLSKIRSLLLQQESMRKAYQKQVDVGPSEVAQESPDAVFLQKALLLVEKNIANPDFSVEELSSDLLMSRVTLYKKILLLTGKTPVEFIRNIRLKRAAQLLETDYLTVSQVAYKVGFKSQKYFVRSFKGEFGMLPSEYRLAKRV